MSRSVNRKDGSEYVDGEQFATDGLARWEPYFGKLDGYTRGAEGYGFGNGDLRADAKARHESYNLPQAYKGKSRHLEDVLDFMRRDEDEFYTSKLLPWELSDDIHIQWQVFKFNRSIADIQPEQGVPRLVTAETDSRSDHLIRRGLAFQLEHGFFDTEQGRRHYVMNLQQITDCVRVTAYFGVMHALLTGKNHYKEWRKRFDRTPKRRHNVLKYEKNMWGLLQKDLKGLYIMDAEVKHDMKLNGVKPNVLVLPSKASIYAQMVPSLETNYMERGDGAHAALSSGKMNTTFRGSEVFECESFDVDFSHENVDLLTRDRMIGQYFVMGRNGTTAQRANVALTNDANRDKRDAAYNIKIFCAEHDKFVEIKYSDAKRHALNSDDARFAGRLLADHRQHHYFTDDEVDAAIRGLRGNRRWNNAVDRLFATDLAIDVAAAANANLTSAGGAQPAPTDSDANVVALLQIAHLVGEFPTVNGAGNRLIFTNEGDERRQRGIISDYLAAGAGNLVAAPPAAGAQAAQAAYDLIVNAGGLVGAHSVASGRLGGEYQTAKDNLLRAITDLDALPGNGNWTVANYGLAAAGAMSVGSLREKLQKYKRIVSELQLNHDAAIADDLNGNDQVLLFRPFATWRMGSAILAEGGRELGSTFHGHHDFQLSDDVVRKTLLGHYTFYSKSVVKRPKMYSIIEDVHGAGYVSGGGSRFFTADSLTEALEEQTLGTPECRDSLIAWNVRSEEEFHNALDLFGRLPEYLVGFDESEQRHFPGAERLRRFFADIDPYRDDNDYLSDSPHINTVCFHGAQMERKFEIRGGGVIRQGDWEVTHLDNGHWGELTYDGCMAVREGKMVEMDKNKVLKVGKQ
jgi:hypothetical protein